MVKIGRFNRLRIIKERSVGYFFDGGEAGDILMPKRHQPDHCAVDDELDVFVFLDAEERLTATVRKPLAQVGEVAWLEVLDVHRVGAFLDWGMTKDLLVPFREMAEPMVAGQHYLVKLLLDDDQRIIGTSRLDEHLSDSAEQVYKTGQDVQLLIAEHTDLGFRAVVDDLYWGILYDNETFQTLHPGQRITGYIRKVREDGKLDLSLKKPGYDAGGTESLAKRILDRIQAQGGFLPLSDKSSPEAIQQAFEVSKKVYKQAVGKLYKERRITIEPGGLRLAPKPAKVTKPAVPAKPAASAPAAKTTYRADAKATKSAKENTLAKPSTPESPRPRPAKAPEGDEANQAPRLRRIRSYNPNETPRKPGPKY
ncbi:MAG: GntR family transcriptional regulator [Candidatus Melainabacteria bacterium HGW-Melainabacteria-1]|nr:MAG: GntR family transcriptional regulator [Candidatus Melainabacteria bacterium HGW-Melainabacteria-1]